MNTVTLIGRITKDPELKYSQSGKAFTKFTLAVTREYNRDEADFINCIAWNKTAEVIAEYQRKGNQIAVQGRLNVRNYEQDGETKWITEVILEKFDFIGSSANNDSKEKKEYQESKNNFDKNIENTDDDFPF